MSPKSRTKRSRSRSACLVDLRATKESTPINTISAIRIPQDNRKILDLRIASIETVDHFESDLMEP